jgi:hypothetical protein
MEISRFRIGLEHKQRSSLYVRGESRDRSLGRVQFRLFGQAELPQFACLSRSENFLQLCGELFLIGNTKRCALPDELGRIKGNWINKLKELKLVIVKPWRKDHKAGLELIKVSELPEN